MTKFYYTFSLMVEVEGDTKKDAVKKLVEALEESCVSEYMIAGDQLEI